MKKILLSLVGFVFWLIFLFSQVNAFEPEAGQPNNQYGVHLAIPDYKDLVDAANLVNSSGGDWGYVTLVMEEKDQNQEKWQTVFDQLRQLHLIPIIRLATTPVGDYWRKPEPGQAQDWADFLASLNWVVKDRYVILFNEPNHGSEWGGAVNPEEYGQVAWNFAQALKKANPNFVVMMAGFDAAAPNQLPGHQDEEIFLRKMLASLEKENKNLFDLIDSWASHSYPNHGFVGSPLAIGRTSIRGYLWELNLLKSLGINKTLPVFITETGWPHAEGLKYQNGLFSSEEVAANFQILFSQLAADSQIKAITPFILNYQGEPFDHFSWKKLEPETGFYSQYQAVQQLKKVKGNPVQEQAWKVISPLPLKVTQNSDFRIPVKIRNDGQAIWNQSEGYRVILEGTEEKLEYSFSDLTEQKPFEEKEAFLHLKTGGEVKDFDLGLAIVKNDQLVTSQHPWPLKILSSVKINYRVYVYPRKKARENDFKLQIYNLQNELVFEKNDLALDQDFGEVSGVNNLILNENYRLVLAKPGFFSRQAFATISEGENMVRFKPMIALDFNNDGQLSLKDLLLWFKKLRNF